MFLLLPVVSALSLVCLSAAPCAAGDDVRFFGRVFPRAGSPAFRAHAARLAALRLESARGGPSKLPSVERGGRPALMG